MKKIVNIADQAVKETDKHAVKTKRYLANGMTKGEYFASLLVQQSGAIIGGGLAVWAAMITAHGAIQAAQINADAARIGCNNNNNNNNNNNM